MAEPMRGDAMPPAASLQDASWATHDRSVLVIPRHALPELPTEVVNPWTEWQPTQPPTWYPRRLAEHDETWLQLVPYVVLRNVQGALWYYRRKGVARVCKTQLSIGVGGHIEPNDAECDLAATATAAARRELQEEVADTAYLVIPPPAAWLYEDHTAVGRVHIGWLYVVAWSRTTEPKPLPDESSEGLGFIAFDKVLMNNRFESWSRLAARFLLEYAA